MFCLFWCFFFKQKTAYEMRISDWSSDVCSSDLHGAWWGNERLDQLTWLPRSMDTPIDTNQIELMRPYINANLNSGAYSSILPDWLVEDNSRLDREIGRASVGKECVSTCGYRWWPYN